MMVATSERVGALVSSFCSNACLSAYPGPTYRTLASKGCSSIPVDTVIQDDSNIDDEDYILTSNDTEIIAQPVNFEATDRTRNSITLEWDIDEGDLNDYTYRIHYSHNDGIQIFKDVKTVSETPPVTVSGLKPFTQYEIKIEAIKKSSDNGESKFSKMINATTDVGQPSAPTIINTTCHGTGELYIEWTKPTE